MSIKDKLQDFKKEILAEIDKKSKEIHHLKSDVDYLIEQSRKEITSESNRLDAGFRLLASEKERFENYKIKTEKAIEEKREIAERRIESERERVERKIESERKSTEERIEKHFNDVIEYLEELQSYGKPPKIIDAYINACFILDEKLAKYYLTKQRPNPNAAEVIRNLRRENKTYLQRIMELEYLISELWPEDIDTSEKEEFEYLDDDEDRVKVFISPSDFGLSESERNQKALNGYLRKRHSKSHVGKMYERYIGYLYEREGYEVEYRGIELGLMDGGIDLVCKRKGETVVVQCKNWSGTKTIHENFICQLYGASRFYDKLHTRRVNRNGIIDEIEWKAKPVFVTSTNLDEQAIKVANALGITVDTIPLDKTYPIIKCNINNNGERIYHLPIDQMYDKTKLYKAGECWAYTVEEAVNKGFRRAKRHFANND